jgi:hypothetical protein
VKTSTLLVGIIAISAIGGIAYFAVKKGAASTVTPPQTTAQPKPSTGQQLVDAGTRLGISILDRLFDRVADAPADV